MSRKVKFRGKRIDNGEWIYGYYAKRCYAIGSTGPDIVVPVIIEKDTLIPEQIDPETVGQFICKDKNGKDVWQEDEVWLKRGGFDRLKCTAIAGFENWVWLYWKDHSTYHWEIAYHKDIELIEEQK